MKEVKVGIVGLGRLGSVHAENLAFKIPGCKLMAACSLEQKELDWAKDYLKVDFVTKDYKQMVDEADIEAVVIVSSSPEHCWMIEYALDAGKHVFTDKPLGCSLEAVQARRGRGRASPGQAVLPRLYAPLRPVLCGRQGADRRRQDRQALSGQGDRPRS